MLFGLGIIKEAIGGITNIVKEPIKGWQDRKTLKVKNRAKIDEIYASVDLKKAESALRMAENGQLITADWDSRAQEQAKHSWKDEILMLIIFFPVMLLFVSPFFSNEFQQKVIVSVQSLNQFPAWYVGGCILGIVASVFGLRWLIGPIIQKVFNPKMIKK